MAGLAGLKEICAYTNRSEPTVKQWITRHGMPATKIGGVWESDTELIDQWRSKRIVEQCKKANAGRW